MWRKRILARAARRRRDDGARGRRRGRRGAAVGLETAFSDRRRSLAPASSRGFTSDEPGLTAYTQSLQRLLTNDVVVQAEVRDLGKQIWEVMLRRAFAVEHGEPLELTTAREIVTKVSFLMQSPAFLDRVKTEVAVAVDALSSSATEHELFDAKRKVLSRMLPEAFMEVIVDFDYIGESGYVQMQAALFDHMMDQTISHLMAAASQQVMTSAGVTDMPAPPQQ